MSDPHHADDAEERAWRAIVENYGERPQLDDPPPGESTAPFGGRFGDLRPQPYDDPQPAPDAGEADELDEEEGFVPPAPPPVPRTTWDRLLAWAGVLGSPAVLLAVLIFSVDIPTVLGYVLVAGFVGGFLYLVYRMPRGPRDPWDDGAQV